MPPAVDSCDLPGGSPGGSRRLWQPPREVTLVVAAFAGLGVESALERFRDVDAFGQAT
jgi:hypothetical protein